MNKKRLLTVFALSPLLVGAASHEIHTTEHLLTPDDGLLLGNGDLSCSIYQTHDELVFRLGKGDVWDRRIVFDGSPKPAHIKEYIDGELREGWKRGKDGKTVATKGAPDGGKRMRELCDHYCRVTEDWPYPCPKPTGELKMRLPTDLSGPMKIDQRVIIEEARAEIVCSWTNGVKISVEALIPYDENVLSLRWKTEGWDENTYIGRNQQRCPVTFTLWRWRDPDYGEFAASYWGRYGQPWPARVALLNRKTTPLPHPHAHIIGADGAIEQAFYPDKLFPDGFKCRMTLRMDKRYGYIGNYVHQGLQGLEEICGDAWVNTISEDSRAGELSVAVTTSRDASLQPPAAKAHGEYRSACIASAKADWDSHGFSLPGDAFLENLWYSTAHARRCVLKSGTVPPGLFMPSTVKDYSFWHGDYHSNYNLQSIYWGALAANQTNQAAAYFDAMEFYRPIGRKIAHDYFGCRGHYIQLEGFPLLADEDHNGTLPLGRAVYMTGWAAEPYWEWYMMTQDRAWLAEKGYPFIKDSALFYLDFLKKAPHPDLPPQLNDGKYHVFPSIRGELGITGNPMDACDLDQPVNMARHSLWMAIRASEELGVDAELREQWRDRLYNLAKSPDYRQFGKDAASQYVYHCYMAQDTMFGGPGELFRPERKWDGKEMRDDDAGDWYPTINGCWRIGNVRNCSCTPEPFYCYMRRLFLKWTHANGMVWAMARRHYGLSGGWTESLSIMAPYQEMLLQSWDGSLRLFPRWPRERDVLFSNWRAQGAFLVTGGQKGGKRRVKVFSERGAECSFVGDWKVTDAEGKEIATKPNRFGLASFSTEVGGTYTLTE